VLHLIYRQYQRTQWCCEHMVSSRWQPLADHYWNRGCPLIDLARGNWFGCLLW